MKMLAIEKERKNSTDDSEVEQLNVIIENTLEFLPETPKIRPIDTISNISFMDLEDIEDFSLDEDKETNKTPVENKFKLSKKKMIRKHRSRKDSDNGVLD